MTRLVITVDAEADESKILRELETKAGPAVAARFALRFRSVLQRLVEMPRIGSPRPALGQDIRCVVIAPYILIYHYAFAESTVMVLRILHGRRKIIPDICPQG
jgi:toxin ParE1/3/4